MELARQFRTSLALARCATALRHFSPKPRWRPGRLISHVPALVLHAVLLWFFTPDEVSGLDGAWEEREAQCHVSNGSSHNLRDQGQQRLVRRLPPQSGH